MRKELQIEVGELFETRIEEGKIHQTRIGSHHQIAQPARKQVGKLIQNQMYKLIIFPFSYTNPLIFLQVVSYCCKASRSD